MFRTRIKICGITSVDDGLTAAAAGADALGFVFWPGSRRCIDSGTAARIVDSLPPFVTTVGLFMDPSEGWVWDVLDSVPLALLQFHGDEEPDFCERFAVPYIKAVPMGGDHSLDDHIARHGEAHGFLLDSHAVAGAAGGTGETFDWSQVPDDPGRPIILAGGLSPANVGAAICSVRPWAVDVSSGVESAPGVKDARLMRDFADAVRIADAE